MSAFSAAIVLFASISTVFADGKMALSGDKYVVEWKHLPATQEIQFNVTVKITSGWVGLGISKENSGMKNLDVYVGTVQDKSIKDMYSASAGKPSESGDTNSITKLSFTTDGGQSNLVFKRKLDTGDSQKDVNIASEEKYYFAWAYNVQAGFLKHLNSDRGYSSLVMLVNTTASPTQSMSSVSSTMLNNMTTTMQTTTTDTGACAQLSSILLLLSMFVAIFVR
ncbi:uncharacterized protein LOC110234275 [Exaiptasia diaphana]|uniref:DOMON domain-containing protein n=1 Tax=Exaiptasia diaphana TaxID=2652724 RepID=A0A913WWY9_EXADI|nr:uncharacterized protein LOC110234275 [Exaiptasia diaphana]KXJ17220.1 hypothetical protein AC249_AIPGENE12314 [Exaiptasia diaphana]